MERAARRTLLLFALASLASVAAGSAIMRIAGLGAGAWLQNPLGWAAGALLAALLWLSAARRANVWTAAFPLLALVALAATLAGEGQQGVHRWLHLGPLNVHVAALLLPSAVVALASAGLTPRFGLPVAALIAALLVLQPDASQASAFAAAMAVLLLRGDVPRAGIAAGLAGAAAVAAAAWLRPDPLDPVPEVELIIGMAYGLSPALAAAATAALAAASLSPLAAGAAGGGVGRAATALAAYFAMVALAPLFGAFPVPLAGLGMSFPVGHWLAVGLLCGSMRAAAARP